MSFWDMLGNGCSVLYWTLSTHKTDKEINNWLLASLIETMTRTPVINNVEQMGEKDQNEVSCTAALRLYNCYISLTFLWGSAESHVVRHEHTSVLTPFHSDWWRKILVMMCICVTMVTTRGKFGFVMWRGGVAGGALVFRVTMCTVIGLISFDKP